MLACHLGATDRSNIVTLEMHAHCCGLSRGDCALDQRLHLEIDVERQHERHINAAVHTGQVDGALGGRHTVPQSKDLNYMCGRTDDDQKSAIFRGVLFLS